MTGWHPFLFVAALYSAALNPVMLTVYPPFSLPPATFRITVLAPRHADNRNLCLSIADADDDRNYLRRSCQSMAGELERKVRTVYWDLRSPGEYVAVADLTRMEDGREKHYVSRQPFRVLGEQP